MITIDNFKAVLRKLDFKENGNIFSKDFTNVDAYLKVDFENKNFIFPQDKGFKVNADFTSNFSSNENFVVFECINRLFEKGYKPEHLELEPKWKVGHGASGGRADILVKDNSGKSLLIIECKTEGPEFNKEWNYTLQRGGQMLTYAKQAGSTQFVCLYASDFSDDKVIYFSNIISLRDNEKLLEELADLKPLSFKEAKALEVEDIYKAWKDTYKLAYATKGIFEKDIQPYHIGKQKFTIGELDEIGSKDIQKKYHEFATILRQHNVSGRENAFDKLVNLFLCKIVDEAKNPEDLKFNWKGIAYDTSFDLQDRLQLLYQAGMKEFLGEDVTYIDNSAIDKAFRFFKKDPDATRETIKKYFRELKFFTNNDFAFIDVHNEKLFYQNSKVLLKIIEMLQNIKLKTETQNQFLGDMFEGFLDNGVKQSEGQFFTPMPIVKFILNSLPLEKIIKESELPPRAIDFACGAGHFLNELALQIKPFVEKHKKTDIKEYYKEILGIEKEYRLSKVAKVSAFMYGQDNIKITYADALGKKAKLADNDFSILVANPPYAVKGFLETLSETERKAYTLFNLIDEKSLSNNNKIETFFFERAKQLLKPGAVAGIILPVSILSKDDSIYTRTREILLKYFQIVAIAEFGSQTFGKTGTNTVTLFLRRKDENPAPADHWKYRVDAWFTDNEADAVYNDSNYINRYCHHIEIDAAQYKTLLKGKPTAELLTNELFTEYKKAFEKLTEIKNLKKPNSAFSRKPKIEQETELKKKFIEFSQSIEKDKLYFFVLATENKQKVLIMKYGVNNKEQKEFLGYSWSSAKGKEGIKYLNNVKITDEDDEQPDATISFDDKEDQRILKNLNNISFIQTPLYNPKDREDNKKVNYYILQNFLGKELAIEEELKPYLNYYSTVDLLDFTRKNFTKQIQLSPRKISSGLASKYDNIKIETILLKVSGNTTKIQSDEILEEGKYPVVTQEQNKLISGYTNIKNAITDLPLIVFGDHSCTFKYVDFPFIRGADGTQLMKVNPTLFNPKCFYYLMDLVDIENKNKYERHFKYLVNAKIPKLPTEIQDLIVEECSAIDEIVVRGQNEIDKAKIAIEKYFDYLNKKSIKKFKLSNDDYFSVSIGRRVLEKEISENPDNGIPVYSANVFQPFGYINKDLLGNFEKPSVLWGIDGDWMVNTIESNKPFYPTDHCGVIRLKTADLNHKYVAWVLNKEGLRLRFSRANRASTDRVKGITINAPSSQDQQKIVLDIEKLEKKISENQTLINQSADKKREVLKKYL